MKERCQVINTHYFTTLHDSTSPPFVLSCCSWITAHRGTFFQVAKPLSLYHEAYLSFPKLTLIPWLECVCTCAMLRKRSISILMILSEALGECLHLLKPKFHKHTSANDCTFPEQAQGRLTLHAITVYFYNRPQKSPSSSGFHPNWSNSWHINFSLKTKSRPLYISDVYKNPRVTGNQFSNFLWSFPLYTFSICPFIDVFAILSFYCFWLELQHV